MYEIEKKFLIKNNNWKNLVVKQRHFMQTYVSPHVRIRIFLDDTKTEGRITVKSDPIDNSDKRMELEYDIPRKDALLISEHFKNNTIYKTRYHLSLYNCKNHYWTVDVYEGDNEGIIVAEIEMDKEDQKIKLPSWVGEEVTKDERYTAAALAFRPFKKWNAPTSSTHSYQVTPPSHKLKDEVKQADIKNNDKNSRYWTLRGWNDLFNGT